MVAEHRIAELEARVAALEGAVKPWEARPLPPVGEAARASFGPPEPPRERRFTQPVVVQHDTRFAAGARSSRDDAAPARRPLVPGSLSRRMRPSATSRTSSAAASWPGSAASPCSPGSPSCSRSRSRAAGSAKARARRWPACSRSACSAPACGCASSAAPTRPLWPRPRSASPAASARCSSPARSTTSSRATSRCSARSSSAAVATFLSIRWHAQVMGWLGLLGALWAPAVLGWGDGTEHVYLVIAYTASIAVLVWRRWTALAGFAFASATLEWAGFVGNGSELLALVLYGLLAAALAFGFEANRRGVTPVEIGPEARTRPSWFAASVLVISAALLALAGWFALDGEQWLTALALVHIAAGLVAIRLPRISRELALITVAIGIVLAEHRLRLGRHRPAAGDRLGPLRSSVRRAARRPPSWARLAARRPGPRAPARRRPHPRPGRAGEPALARRLPGSGVRRPPDRARRPAGLRRRAGRRRRPGHGRLVLRPPRRPPLAPAARHPRARRGRALHRPRARRRRPDRHARRSRRSGWRRSRARTATGSWAGPPSRSPSPPSCTR